MSQTKDIARDCSPFLDKLIERQPAWFDALQSSGRLEEDSPPCTDALAGEIEKHGLDPGLRRFRNREMMRIGWRELNSVATLEQTMGDLSSLAELSLQAAMDGHAAQLTAKLGTPHDNEGQEQRLVVLALGKLGGQELNMSSDIDIVFCYRSGGQCDGPRHLSNEQYFLRLARAMVKSLSEVTADGFCFRVDTRLRPFGDAGPLVCSFGAMEQYYQREGRDWERYALIKARPVAGDIPAGSHLLGQLKPFVYRRYIDFGAVEALRDMLASIREDAARKDREQDIKRGPGGIREIEFLVQCLQLLRGGREPQLQTPRLLEALDELQALGHLPEERATHLRQDYAFLRRLENVIQALHDQQTHTIPVGADLARTARAMGYAATDQLLDQLDVTRDRVSQTLEESFPQPPGDAPKIDWRSLLEQEDQSTKELVSEFSARLARSAPSQRALGRLDRFMPMLIERMRAGDLAPSVQSDILQLVLAICRRSAYLSLLVQNPAALDRMIELFRTSDWIAGSVIRYPALLDELIDPALGQVLPDANEMALSAKRILGGNEDPESALQALNYLKRAYSLRTAVAELENVVDSTTAQQILTQVAETLVDSCLQLATGLMGERHGVLPPPGLVVIAYGTLGAGDTSYGSDLDLIFLYRACDQDSDGARPLAPEQYWTRLTRRLLSLATAISASGRLYEIDTRLRPNGRAGLLVSSISAFQRYQLRDAWVWELQALVRARAVAGDADLASQFEEVRRQVLGVNRDPEELRREVAGMRHKMRAELVDADPFKHSPGALVDIDFISQLGVLQMAHAHPGLLQPRGSREQLALLADCGWLGEQDADTLVSTHEALVRARQLHALSRGAREEMPETGRSWDICRKFLE